MVQQKYVLQSQMREKHEKINEAHEQYLKEKEQVNLVVQKLIEDDKRFSAMSKEKKAIAFAEMVEALEDKAQRFRQQKEREKAENIQYRQHLEKLEQREYEFKLKRAEMEEIK